MHLPADCMFPTRPHAGKQGAHVLIRYLVHPGVHSDFIDTWQKVADTVGDDEKGNRVYNLRKVGCCPGAADCAGD